ncbi:hypothetical protein GCM10022403_047700 [Streptomyces coacervatus]|uniref:Chaplin n=1 Tax=Streptomyces coacervatus TaxID=647381 RepID=A0ABP7HZ89_9ACTN|nr:hypothetical protein [Streptomyces coacervatus]MDF2266371.1 hypothetical protein [Streptomyces coacervatus]
MKKITALAALTMTGLALATPAHADNGNNPGPRVYSSHHSPFSSALCREALTLVPVIAPVSDQALEDACNNREHADEQTQPVQ